MGIREKIVVYLLISFLLAVGALATFTYIIASSHMEGIIKKEYMKNLQLLADKMESYVTEIRDDLNFLSTILDIELRFRHNFKDNDHLTHLIDILKDFLSSDPSYREISFFGVKEGGILIKKKDGSFVIQFKETLPHKEAFLKGKDVIINSKDHLLLRFSNSLNDSKGLVVLDIDASSLLSLKPGILKWDGISFFILDSSGRYIKSKSEKLSIFHEYPEIRRYELRNSSQIIRLKDRYIFIYPIYISSDFPFILGFEVLRDVVEVEMIRFKRLLSIVVGGIILITIFFSLYFTKKVTYPVGLLTQTVSKMEEGDFGCPVCYGGKDEIGRLAESLDNMRATIKKKTERLSHLYELGITTSREPQDIADKIVKIIGGLIGRGMVSLSKIKGDTLSMISIYDRGRIIHNGDYRIMGSIWEEIIGYGREIEYHNILSRYPNERFFSGWQIDYMFSVPVISPKGTVTGIISFMDREKVELSQEDIELIKILSQRISFEWEKEREEQWLDYSRRKIWALYKVVSSLNQPLSLEKILQNVTMILVDEEFFKVKREALIFLIDRETGTLNLKYHLGITEEIAQYSQSFKIGECLCGKAAREGRLIYCPDCSMNPAHTRNLPGHGTHADICIPLKSRDKVLGVIHLHRDTGAGFSDEDMDIFEMIGNHVGMAIDNALMFEEIQNYSIELEKRVRERTIELERANRAKSDFLASVSHELRTPLNVIIGFSEVLKEGYFGPLNEKQLEYVEDILDSGRHLLSIINDILDLSKVEAGKVELELKELVLGEIIERSLILIKEKSMRHNIRLEISIPEELASQTLMADERKFKQIMFNLLSNAAKFTPDGGSIRVEVSAVSDMRKRIEELRREIEYLDIPHEVPEGRGVEISVIDTGIGIPPEYHKKIFEDFFQIDSGIEGKTPGTGLGLPLSKRLVELHGGVIWVESEGKGKGSKFSFILPLRGTLNV